MENAICNLLQSTSTKEFLSTLKNYGECIDYSNDYERSKALTGIFVGIVNKVYDAVPKGKGGHPEHDAMFISAKSLINCRRESQPFRIGFAGDIVQQLIEVNINQGDAIGILKPTFFYSLDVPSLSAGTGSVVVWIGKNLQDSQVTLDAVKSSSESQNYQHRNKQQSSNDKSKKRRIMTEGNDCYSDNDSVTESSTLSSISLHRNVQIYRSKPVVLHKTSMASDNNKLIPDSTTKSVLLKCQEKRLHQNKESHDTQNVDNIVSQNTANDGSAEILVKNQDFTNSKSLSKIQRVPCCCRDNCDNQSGYNPNSEVISCLHKCHCSDICNRQTTSRKCSFHHDACNSKSFCECVPRHCCFCYRPRFCTYTAIPHNHHCNHVYSCHNNVCSSSRHVDHSFRSTKLCSQAKQGNCVCLQRSCCHNPQFSCTRNFCLKSVHCDQQCNNLYSTCHSKLNYCANTCCTNLEEALEDIDHNLNSNVCNRRTNSPAQMHFSQPENIPRNLIETISDDSHVNSRTKDWVRNWSQNPPGLQNLPEQSESTGSEMSFRKPSSCNDCVHQNKGMRVTNEKNLVETATIIQNDSNNIVMENLNKKHSVKKKKLFSPLDNSTIISEKSIYQNATIIEESTPFNSEDQTCAPPINSFPSENILRSSNNNDSSKLCVELPISNADVDHVKNASAVLHQSNGKEKTSGNESGSIVPIRKLTCTDYSNDKILKEPLNNRHQTDQNKETESNLEDNRISSDEQFPELRLDSPVVSQTECIELQRNESRQNTCLSREINDIPKEAKSFDNNATLMSLDCINDAQCEDSVAKKGTNIKKAENYSKSDAVVSNDLNVRLSSENNENPESSCSSELESIHHKKTSLNEVNARFSKSTEVINNDSGKENSLRLHLQLLDTEKKLSNNDPKIVGINAIHKEVGCVHLDTEKVISVDGVTNSLESNTNCNEMQTADKEVMKVVENSLNKEAQSINANVGKKTRVLDTASNEPSLHATFHKKPEKSNSSNISLSLSCYSKSKSCDDNHITDMEITLNCDDKGQKRSSNDNLDETTDVMEFTFEPKLMKKRKKCSSNHSSKCSRESKTSGSSKSKENICSGKKEFSVCSSGTFYDAKSDGLSSQNSSKWCLKSVDMYGHEKTSFDPKVLKSLGLLRNDSCNLNLFSTFEVLGAIINIVPNLSPENFGGIVKGFCNEGCRREYRYEDYYGMVTLDETCTFCRLRFHMTCPECSKKGLTHPLCLYYSFEIHLLDGKNVFRIEIEHQGGITFTGCTPQIYLSSNKLFKKISKIIAKHPIKWSETVLLKARVKVAPKGGVAVLALQDTSLRKDLTLNRKHYKF